MRRRLLALGSLLLALGLPAAQACADITSNLNAYYTFDEGSGTSAADSSGNGNTGTITDATWVSGKVGSGALSFDGANDWVEIASSASMNITGPITLAAWIKTTDSVNRTIVSGYKNSWPYSGYGLGMGLGTANRASYWSGAHGDWVVSNDNINSGSWTHVAVSVSSTTATFYVNGTASGTPTTAEPDSYTDVRRIGATRTGANDFNGQADEVRIYSRALSSSDITELYNFTGASTTPVIVYYQRLMGMLLPLRQSGFHKPQLQYAR